MKKLFLLALVAWIGILLPAQGQNVLHTFRFDKVSDKPGTGYIKIYDNQTAEFYGNGHFHHTLKFESLSLSHDIIFCLFSNKGNREDNFNKPYIMIWGGDFAYYVDRSSPDSIFDALSNSKKGANNSVFNAMLNAFENKTGAFANFRSTSDIELPLSIEGYTTTHTFNISPQADEKAYSVRTKSGKYVDDTSVGEYEVWTDASWLTIRGKTEAAFLLKWEANTSGAPRSANVYVKGGNKTTQMIVSQPNLKVAINQVWVEHNKFQGLVKGMKIHVKFSTYGVRGMSGSCTAYFSFANGTRLIDYNGAFRAMDGQVSCGGTFIPQYDACTYPDYVLFMPYSELHISGKADCKFLVQVMIGGQYDSSQEYSFSFQ